MNKILLLLIISCLIYSRGASKDKLDFHDLDISIPFIHYINITNKLKKQRAIIKCMYQKLKHEAKIEFQHYEHPRLHINLLKFLYPKDKEYRVQFELHTYGILLVHYVIKMVTILNLFREISRMMLKILNDPYKSKNIFRISISDLFVRSLSFASSLLIIGNSLRTDWIYLLIELTTVGNIYYHNPNWDLGNLGYNEFMSFCLTKNGHINNQGHNYTSYMYLISNFIFEFSYYFIFIIYQIISVYVYSDNLYEIFINGFYLIENYQTIHNIEEQIIDDNLRLSIKLSLYVYDLERKYYNSIFVIFVVIILGSIYASFTIQQCWPYNYNHTLYLINKSVDADKKYKLEALDFLVRSGRDCTENTMKDLYLLTSLFVSPYNLIEWMKIRSGYFSYKNFNDKLVRYAQIKAQEDVKIEEVKESAKRFKQLDSKFRRNNKQLNEINDDLGEILSLIEESKRNDS